MVRALGKTMVLMLLILAGSVALYVYHRQNSAEHQIQVLEEQNREKDEVIGRLKTERRVARVLVTDQKTVNGRLLTTLLFVEYRRDGSALPARQFVIDGDEVHFDAQIVKFKDEYVEAGDPLRGQSIMLFTRIYGAHQAPADGFPIDEPGHIPEFYRGIDPKISQFEQGIWADFWKLYNDQDARETRGIRGLHGEGLFGMFEKGHVYTITLRPDGGTINEEPVDPMYRQAMGEK